MEELNKILIVDDERLSINVLADLLKPNYGYFCTKHDLES